jgi:transposase
MERNNGLGSITPFGNLMKSNTSIPLGGAVIIRNIEERFGLFSKLFGGLGGDAKDFVPLVKLHLYNKLTHSVSVNQILETYSEELFELLGMKESPGERTLYRTLERTGKCFPVVMERYQRFINENNFVDSNQIIDFSSTHMEGEKSELAVHGYSRDHRPDRPQINFGISTGINSIPTALTVQKGNVQDKKHMREILKLLPEVIPEDSLLIFDTGGNTRKNKETMRNLHYHYLTLRAKRVGNYKTHIGLFNERMKEGSVEHFQINCRPYYCVKKKENDGSVSYLYFSPEQYRIQMKIKEKKFQRQKEKGNKMLGKRKPTILPSDMGWVELIPSVQKTLFSMDNPYINGLEGFFILESSVDADPEKILRLYKERDKAEKFIRALKEGMELRPIRHWNTWSVIGIFFISFLANFLINLTQLLSKISPVKNVKLLKKSLINLTLTIVYPKNGFRFRILSNVSPQILAIFGDFVWKFGDKSLSLRW